MNSSDRPGRPAFREPSKPEVDQAAGRDEAVRWTDDLRAITSRIYEVGGLAERQFGAALEALRTRDGSLADEVVRGDRHLDRSAAEIEELAILLLARPYRSPAQVRQLVAALKIASTLERIGDLGKNIAKRALVLNGSEPMRIVNSVVRMGRQTQTLLADALDAYARLQTEPAIAVWRRDVELDQVYGSLFSQLITGMTNDPRTIAPGSQLQFIIKNLERIGDHATFIAEMTYFVAEGRPLTETRPKFDTLRTFSGSDRGEANREAS